MALLLHRNAPPTTIAAYTLVDRVGIHRASAPSTYFVLTLVGPCLVYPPLVGARAMRASFGFAGRCPRRSRTIGSFVLGLLALRHASAASVLAVRSLSVVIATALAGRVLAERVSRAAARSVAGLLREPARRLVFDPELVAWMSLEPTP